MRLRCVGTFNSLHNHCWVCWWKNFENRSVSLVVGKSSVLFFYSRGKVHVGGKLKRAMLDVPSRLMFNIRLLVIKRHRQQRSV